MMSQFKFRGGRTTAGPRVTAQHGSLSWKLEGEVDWGYYGGACLRLAELLLGCVYSDPALVERCAQEFKRRVVAGLPERGWELTEQEIRAAVEAIEKEQG